MRSQAARVPLSTSECQSRQSADPNETWVSVFGVFDGLQMEVEGISKISWSRWRGPHKKNQKKKA
jgi:hypothetical protein